VGGSNGVAGGYVQEVRGLGLCFGSLAGIPESEADVVSFGESIAGTVVLGGDDGQRDLFGHQAADDCRAHALFPVKHADFVTGFESFSAHNPEIHPAIGVFHPDGVKWTAHSGRVAFRCFISEIG